MLRLAVTTAGTVEGVAGRHPSVTAFRGIPYAAAPVGELRFAPPQPHPAWEGVYLADRFGPMCPQTDRDAGMAGRELERSEDCLSLNLWTAAETDTERRPVLVWIYGGGFRAGTGAAPEFDGESLAARGLIVVTFNYRVGAFGFLATPELSAELSDGASGNYGLLDDIAALRWVHDNVTAFGGDPDNVTIAGQSAGAGSVNFLAMSPLARGLFHRAIAQSHARHSRDTELRYLSTSYRTLADAEDAGQRWARALGAGTPRQLRALDAEQLIAPDDLVDAGVPTGSAAKPPLFRPAVDGWVIPSGYAVTYGAGAQSDVAYIAGSNADEAGAIPEAMAASMRHARNGGARPGAPPVHVTVDGHRRAALERFGALADEFLAHYPADDDASAAQAASTAARDNSRVATYFWALEWRVHTTAPLYTYFWTHPSPAGGAFPRAFHASEIPYVFGNVVAGRGAWTERDADIARTMSGYWRNFVATGDPNGEGLPRWAPFDPERRTVMQLGAGFGPMPIAEPERFAFWERFFAATAPW